MITKGQEVALLTMYHVFRDVAKGQEVAGAIKGDTQVSESGVSTIFLSNLFVVG